MLLLKKKIKTASTVMMMQVDDDGAIRKMVSAIPWFGLVLIFVVWVATKGAGISSTLSLVFFCVLALSV